MIYLTLFFEFFKIGLFSIGGGLATIPFLNSLALKTHWFSQEELIKMIALSESTPGPLGVNMATYVGFQTKGILGGLVATFGLVIPSLFVIIAISYFLQKFKTSLIVQSIFKGLRPAVAGMIFSFIVQIGRIAFQMKTIPSWQIAILFLCYLGLIIRYKIHPICYIILAGLVGTFLQIE